MNYRTNEDKLCPPNEYGAQYNLLHSVDDISSPGGGSTEPVTLQEVKDYMRLEGFTPVGDESPGELDFDDTLIADLITEARMWVEKYTEIHLIPKELQVVLSNSAGMTRLPGPVTGAISIVSIGDNESPTDEVKVVGVDFPQLRYPKADLITLTYAAGYDEAPAWAKNAIKAYVLDHYEYRGDDAPPAANKRAAAKARPYRRIPMWG